MSISQIEPQDYYRIVKAPTVYHLKTLVARYVEQGYIPTGGVAIERPKDNGQFTYYQAIVYQSKSSLAVRAGEIIGVLISILVSISLFGGLLYAVIQLLIGG